MEKKRCPRCGETKDRRCFGTRNDRRRKARSWCTLCRRAHYLARKANNPAWYEAQKSAIRMRRGSSPEIFLRYLWLIAKNRFAKVGGTITRSDLVELYRKQGGLCYYTGLPMTWIMGSGRVDTNISMDRVDSSSGYHVGNVVLCCLRVNLMKAELPIEELLRWGSLISEYQRGPRSPR